MSRAETWGEMNDIDTFAFGASEDPDQGFEERVRHLESKTGSGQRQQVVEVDVRSAAWL